MDATNIQGLFGFFFVFVGNSSECPTPGNLPDKTECVDRGQCHGGECVPFCEATQKLQSCACNGECRLVSVGTVSQTLPHNSSGINNRLPEYWKCC